MTGRIPPVPPTASATEGATGTPGQPIGSVASEREALFASLRRDLALVNEIPLYYIDHESAAPDGEFTLDQHLAFNRLTDAIPSLLGDLEELRSEAVREEQRDSKISGGPVAKRRPEKVGDRVVTPSGIHGYVALVHPTISGAVLVQPDMPDMAVYMRDELEVEATS